MDRCKFGLYVFYLFEFVFKFVMMRFECVLDVFDVEDGVEINFKCVFYFVV